MVGIRAAPGIGLGCAWRRKDIDSRVLWNRARFQRFDDAERQCDLTAESVQYDAYQSGRRLRGSLSYFSRRKSVSLGIRCVASSVSAVRIVLSGLAIRHGSDNGPDLELERSTASRKRLPRIRQLSRKSDHAFVVAE